ncbi:MAG: sugar phosphate isomerase/epimerase [Rhodospirillales bacterium]|nr:sugar phosphate isomerase/epimerase [Rhodospirillales bacterium]
MKFSVSNIGLPAGDHLDTLPKLAEMGLAAIEVAPSRVWSDTWHGLDSGQVANYRRAIEAAGLGVVGLHSLFFDHPELGLFRDPETRIQTQDFMVHLSAICRDLGGHTLIYGGGRRRGDIAADTARTEALDFLGQLSHRIADHGTCFCFEPLGPLDTDFINSVDDSIDLVRALDVPQLQVQIDAKALVENDEVDPDVFESAKPWLVHYHANEPGLGVLGSSGRVDHGALGRMLGSIGYDRYVSIEQRMLNQDDPLADLAESFRVLKQNYSA